MDGKIFEKLIEVSECAFFISKPGGEMEITYASKKFYSILQYTKEEFQEKFKNSLMAVILPATSFASGNKAPLSTESLRFLFIQQ